MASGIDVSDECGQILECIKSRKQRFCFFKISDDSKHIEPVYDNPEEKTFGSELLNLVDLKASSEDAEKCSEAALREIVLKLKPVPLEPRYIYFNYVCDKGGRTIDKMVLFLYSSDSSKIKLKMLYSSSKDALKKVITTSFVDIHITDLDDFEDFKEIKNQVIVKSGST